MKSLLIITIFSLCSFGIFAQTFIQSDINDSLRTKIEKEIWGDYAYRHWSVRPLPTFYEHMRNGIEKFILVMLVIDRAIDSIILDLPAIAIYGNYQRGFTRTAGTDMVYTQYHDIYSSLFSFKEIDIVRVFDCWYDCRNITFLPLKSHDFQIAMENAIFRRSWYISGLDYYELLGEDRMENRKFFNEQWEFLAKELEILIYKYQNQNSEILHNKNAKFESLFLKYDKMEVLIATWHISPYFKRKYEEWIGFDDDLFTFELGIFYGENAHLLKMDKHLTDCDFARIERWQLMHEKLYSVPVSQDEGEDVEFAMIIFYMKDGEKFYSRFINRGIGQYFGSLSTSGNSLLLNSVLYYLTFADSDAVEAFFIDYFETFQNLIENPPHYE